MSSTWSYHVDKKRNSRRTISSFHLPLNLGNRGLVLPLHMQWTISLISSSASILWRRIIIEWVRQRTCHIRRFFPPTIEISATPEIGPARRDLGACASPTVGWRPFFDSEKGRYWGISESQEQEVAMFFVKRPGTVRVGLLLFASESVGPWPWSESSSSCNISDAAGGRSSQGDARHHVMHDTQLKLMWRSTFVTVTDLSLVQVWFSAPGHRDPLQAPSSASNYYVSFQILIMITLSRPFYSRIQASSRVRLRNPADLY